MAEDPGNNGKLRGDGLAAPVKEHTTKFAIGMPWYAGPDVCTYADYQEFFLYLGRLKERSLLRAQLGHERFMELLPKLSPLSYNLHNGQPVADPLADPTEEDWQRLGIVEIGEIDYSRTSLPGKARELCVESAQVWGADWLYMWDADMKFQNSFLLRLWRHQKPVIAALAFSAREPYIPVIYSIHEDWDTTNNRPKWESDPVLDYPQDRLITNKDIGGAMAFGAGMVLIDMKVFKQIPQPWFNVTGAGEDWFFCVRCHQYNVPRYVDTSVKMWHKKYAPEWVSEEVYLKARKEEEPLYKARYPSLFTAEGKVKVFESPSLEKLGAALPILATGR